ncbi:hypothetical protein ID866_9224 [Astraeus odoratus]
MQWN